MKTREFVRDLIKFIDASEPSDWVLGLTGSTMIHWPTRLEIWISCGAGHPWRPHDIPLPFWHRWRVMAAIRRMQRRIIIGRATSPTRLIVRGTAPESNP